MGVIGEVAGVVETLEFALYLLDGVEVRETSLRDLMGEAMDHCHDEAYEQASLDYYVQCEFVSEVKATIKRLDALRAGLARLEEV